LFSSISLSEFFDFHDIETDFSAERVLFFIKQRRMKNLLHIIFYHRYAEKSRGFSKFLWILANF